MHEQRQWLGKLKLFLEEENLQLKNKTICMFVKTRISGADAWPGLKTNTRLPIPEDEKKRLYCSAVSATKLEAQRKI
jgi:hypothetical protein